MPELQASLFDIERIYDEIRHRTPSAALGFTNNPFPPTGIASSSEAQPFFLSPVHATSLNAFVRAALQGNDFCGLVVLGEYGSGKTSLLGYFARQVADAQMRGIPIGSVYVSTPGTSFSDVLQSITRSLTRELLQKYAWGHLVRFIRDRDHQERLEQFSLPNPSPEQLAQVSDRPSFWKLFGETMGVKDEILSEAVGSMMRQTLADSSFAEDLAGLMLGNRNIAGHSWTQLSRSIPPSSTKKPIASDRMDSLLTLLNSNGIEHLFLLIDEFEDVVFSRMTKRLRDDFTATLRAVIGSHGSRLSIVLASNVPGWNLLMRSDASLEDRFRYRIDLQELEREEIIQILWRYVEPARDSESDVAEALFGDGFANLALKYGKNRPRLLLSFCYSFTEFFWESPTVPDLGHIEQFFAAGG